MSRRLVYALLAMTAAQAAVYVARPMTSYRLLGLGAGAREVGLVTAAFALLPLFLAIPLGRYADRRHGGPLLLVGCAVQTCACVLLGLADTSLTIALASALLGLGHLGLALGAQAVIARESDERRHDQHFGLLAAGVSLGQLVGPLVGGFVLEGRSLAAGTERAMFVAAGIAAAATVCAALAERHVGAEAAARDGPARGSVREIVRTRGVPTGIFASLAVLAAADVFTAYMPVLGEERGISPGLVGVLLAVRAAASIGARIGIGPIVERMGRLRLISLAAAASAAAFAAMTVAHDPIVLGVLAAVAGFGLGFGQPLSMTLVVQLVPESSRATALAVRLTGNRIGQVAAPAVAGLIAGGAGVASVFWLLGAMLVGSAVGVARMRGSRSNRDWRPRSPPQSRRSSDTARGPRHRPKGRVRGQTPDMARRACPATGDSARP